MLLEILWLEASFYVFEALSQYVLSVYPYAHKSFDHVPPRKIPPFFSIHKFEHLPVRTQKPKS